MGLFANIQLNNIGNSIIKLDGQEAIHDITSNFQIAFNGEIYNREELLQLIHSENISEKSTDAEIMLYGFIDKREKILDLIDGVFAFVTILV